jgi:hypothetical protein
VWKAEEMSLHVGVCVAKEMKEDHYGRT